MASEWSHTEFGVAASDFERVAGDLVREKSNFRLGAGDFARGETDFRRVAGNFSWFVRRLLVRLG
jgi:hypothetical protein